MGVKKDITEVMTRTVKLLLYPDNEQHVSAFDNLKELFPDFIAILHKGYDGKKDHWHIACRLGDTPVRVGTFCRKIKLIKDDLEPDIQFVRLIGGRLSGFLVYLTHLSEPDKEQYSAADLFGSSGMLAEYGKAATKFIRNEIDMQDAVIAVLDWLKYQEGIVRLSSFARWICGTPYFKASSSPLVRGLIQEHNERIYNAARKSYLDDISDSAVRMQGMLAYPETFDSSVLQVEDFEPLY